MKSIEEVVMEKMAEAARKELEERYDTVMHEINLIEKDFADDKIGAKANSLLNVFYAYGLDLQKLLSRYYAMAYASERIRQEIVQEIFDQNPGIGFGEMNAIMSRRAAAVSEVINNEKK